MHYQKICFSILEFVSNEVSGIYIHASKDRFVVWNFKTYSFIIGYLVAESWCANLQNKFNIDYSFIADYTARLKILNTGKIVKLYAFTFWMLSCEQSLPSSLIWLKKYIHTIRPMQVHGIYFFQFEILSSYEIGDFTRNFTLQIAKLISRVLLLCYLNTGIILVSSLSWILCWR